MASVVNSTQQNTYGEECGPVCYVGVIVPP